MRKQDQPVVRFEKRGREFFLVARLIPLEEAAAKARPLWARMKMRLVTGLRPENLGVSIGLLYMESLFIFQLPGKNFLR